MPSVRRSHRTALVPMSPRSHSSAPRNQRVERTAAEPACFLRAAVGGGRSPAGRWAGSDSPRGSAMTEATEYQLGSNLSERERLLGQCEIHGPLRSMYHCHCSACRRANGASFATNASLTAADFSLVAGEDLISNFESSEGVRRHFCSRCGSPIYASVEQSPNMFYLRCGTLDGDPHTRPAFHIYVKTRAPWQDISDQLP